MKTYDCQICGHLVLLEPREVEEIGAYCLEHLFSEQLPALNQQADDAAAKEERPGPVAKQESQAAHTDTYQKESDMTHSTPEPAEFGTFRAMSKEVKEEAVVDIDGTVYGMDATFKRASLFVIGEEGERPEVQFGLYNVFDSDGEQVHQQRLIIQEDAHKEVWIDAYPVVFQHVAEWLLREASKLIPGGDDR